MGAVVGLLGVVVLAGVASYAGSRVDASGVTQVGNPSPPSERVRVEVLNAGGVSGQARAATIRLRDLGFDVVAFGNANTFDRDSSTVVDRVGRPDLARAVAQILGIQQVEGEADPNLFVDVTVFLGKDWLGDQEEADSEGVVPEREPWDPRGWIGR